jgi:hypothetical protein
MQTHEAISDQPADAAQHAGLAELSAVDVLMVAIMSWFVLGIGTVLTIHERPTISPAADRVTNFRLSSWTASTIDSGGDNKKPTQAYSGATQPTSGRQHDQSWRFVSLRAYLQ